MLIYESIKDLEINTSMLLNLFFAKKTMLPCFFCLIADLCFLIPDTHPVTPKYASVQYNWKPY